MKISFTDIRYKDERIAAILAECDLIFSISEDTPLLELEALYPGKVIRLQHTCNSNNLLNRILDRDFEQLGDIARRKEYETIYAALPKGVEITGHTYGSLIDREEPIKFTLSYD